MTALLLLAVAAPSSASTSATIEGHWTNPKHTEIVNVSHCGDAYCGTVRQGLAQGTSDKAHAAAAPHLIGAE